MLAVLSSEHAPVSTKPAPWSSSRLCHAPTLTTPYGRGRISGGCSGVANTAKQDQRRHQFHRRHHRRRHRGRRRPSCLAATERAGVLLQRILFTAPSPEGAPDRSNNGSALRFPLRT